MMDAEDTMRGKDDYDMENIHAIDTVALSDADSALVIIDQTLLPRRVELLRLHTREEMWEAIHTLRVRGAPAIGAAAAVGIYLLAKQIEEQERAAFLARFAQEKAYLASSRPTAVNLFWALDRMERRLLAAQGSRKDWLAALREEAETIIREDIAVCRALGEQGLTLLRDGDGVLTHCNAGKLATTRYGTATAPFYLAQERGMHLRIYADETRPLLQGARLTAFELQSAGLDVTLICDNMAASVMQKGLVQAVFTGCDRVAANGDSANKIGTLGLAILARHYGIPFYIFAPTSTIDLQTPCGADIVIEQRPGREITDLWYAEPMAPAGVKTLNPAFDVTDASLICGIVTEKGILYPPYTEAIARIMG